MGGLFGHSLQEQSRPLSSESHPRQWVDRSSPAYKNSLGDTVPNPTPAYKEQSRRLSSESHPRQWVDRSSPAYKNKSRRHSSESHPSLQEQSRRLSSESPLTAVGGLFEHSLHTTEDLFPLCLSLSPLAARVGEKPTKDCGWACRLDLKDPPIAETV